MILSSLRETWLPGAQTAVSLATVRFQFRASLVAAISVNPVLRTNIPTPMVCITKTTPNSICVANCKILWKQVFWNAYITQSVALTAQGIWIQVKYSHDLLSSVSRFGDMPSLQRKLLLQKHQFSVFTQKNWFSEMGWCISYCAAVFYFFRSSAYHCCWDHLPCTLEYPCCALICWPNQHHSPPLPYDHIY